MLYGILEVDFFSTPELLHPNMKFRLRLIRARPIFYMIGDNRNVSHGIADCSLYLRRLALKNEYHKKQMDMLGILQQVAQLGRISSHVVDQNLYRLESLLALKHPSCNVF